ncbi:LCP family protein [Desulforamulus ruminis]|uniref:LCP family protein n=1 Tax=Desulforamulus ruminis TaxID=1564 RepID=UPI002354BAB4|nr:LCP family protein [Desulforamulus ruminis]
MEGKKRKKLKIIPFLLFCSFLVLIFGVGYVLANQFIFDRNVASELFEPDSEEKAKMDKRLNFLLMGIDAREGETNTRTDTLILVSVDKEHNRIAMLSLPRDTRVRIPGHGYDKINAANVYGGPELVMEVVSDMVGMDIDNYLMTNVRGFRDIVDTLGGVTLDVEKRMYHYDPYDEPDLRKIDLQPGLQKLDGNKALQYVRFRSDALGDVARTERQQKFLKALAKEMVQPSTITKIPRLVPTINKYLKTNLSLTEMVALARAGQDLSNVEMVTQTMPGKFLNMDGVSYWSVDPDQAHMVARSMIEEGKAFDVVLGEENINTSKKTTSTPETGHDQSTEKEVTPEDSTGNKTGGSKTGTTTDKKNQSNIGQKDPGAHDPNSNVQVIVKPSGNDSEQPEGNTGTSNTTPKNPEGSKGGNSNSGSNHSSNSWLPAQPL